jgi:hypothetical protein
MPILVKSMNMRRQTRFRLCVELLVLVILLLSAIYFGLPVYALVWHVVHGNSVRCGRFTITVPAGWWARNSCELVTPSVASALMPQTPVQLFVNLQYAPSVQDTQWRKDVQAKLETEGYSLDGVRELTVATGQTFCFEFRSPTKHIEGSTIACDIDQKMVLTFFYDDPKFKSTFYQILSSIK